MSLTILRRLSFEQTVWGGVVLAGLCGAGMAGVGFYALHFMSSIQEEVASDHAADVTQVAKLGLAIERHFGSEKAYLLTGDEEFLRERYANERDLAAQLEKMPNFVTTTEGKRHLAAVERSATAYRSAMDAAVAKRSSGATPDEVRTFFESEAAAKRRELDAALERLEDYKVHRLDGARAVTAGLYEHARKIMLRAYVFGIFGIVALGVVAARALVALRDEQWGASKPKSPLAAHAVGR